MGWGCCSVIVNVYLCVGGCRCWFWGLLVYLSVWRYYARRGFRLLLVLCFLVRVGINCRVLISNLPCARGVRFVCNAKGWI